MLLWWMPLQGPVPQSRQLERSAQAQQPAVLGHCRGKSSVETKDGTLGLICLLHRIPYMGFAFTQSHEQLLRKWILEGYWDQIQKEGEHLNRELKDLLEAGTDGEEDGGEAGDPAAKAKAKAKAKGKARAKGRGRARAKAKGKATAKARALAEEEEAQEEEQEESEEADEEPEEDQEEHGVE